MARADAGRLRIEVVYCPGPGQCDQVSMQLAPGATLADAVRASALCLRHGLDPDTVLAGIWSRVQPPDTLLRDRDRVELYRALRVDPKEARRLRYKGAKAAKSAKSPPRA